MMLLKEYSNSVERNSKENNVDKIFDKEFKRMNIK
jgi:hypothetical protein